jgi:hypothetical protein
MAVQRDLKQQDLMAATLAGASFARDVFVKQTGHDAPSLHVNFALVDVSASIRRIAADHGYSATQRKIMVGTFRSAARAEWSKLISSCGIEKANAPSATPEIQLT